MVEASTTNSDLFLQVLFRGHGVLETLDRNLNTTLPRPKFRLPVGELQAHGGSAGARGRWSRGVARREIQAHGGRGQRAGAATAMMPPEAAGPSRRQLHSEVAKWIRKVMFEVFKTEAIQDYLLNEMPMAP